jgi:membrane protease YdiL (CAAX protease family)
MTDVAPRPGFWRVVRLLLVAARQRAVGRRRQQMKMRRRRGGGKLSLTPAAGFVIGCALGVVVHVLAATDVKTAVSTAARVEAEANGKLVVDDRFLQRIQSDETAVAQNASSRDAATRDEELVIQREARRLANDGGGDATALASRLRAQARTPEALVNEDSVWRANLALPDFFALVLTLWWALMLICQGEGPDFDSQRSRHPMWEWLSSHPAPPAAIFLAEMLSPIAANPIYLTAPLFPGMLFASAYGWQGGVAAAALIGVPLAVALACIGKAIEIRALLALSPRARGAALGLMGWFGFVSMWSFVLLSSSFPTIGGLAKNLLPLAAWPWPPMRALIGLDSSGGLEFWRACAICLLLSAALIAAAVAFSLRSARLGLAGRFRARSARRKADDIFALSRDPLYRKEWLWFRRDGGALVQAVLVPMSLAGLQVFSLSRSMSSAIGWSWNSACGVAVLFGTYFLLTLGPKSLASEGQALWIALTWPRGLESLLKTKARLWAVLATGIVSLALIWTVYCFPADWTAIAGVAALWLVFARSLAEKTVTLATTTSSSGEQEKVPSALTYAAWLGTLSFAVGVLTRQWSLAVAGVAFSTMTAAAMWQNFRYRLPFLYDPWSQTLPPAPTLLHAMIAIAGMLEAISLFSAFAVAKFGAAHVAAINAGLYGLCAIAASAAVVWFLRARGIVWADVWLWRDKWPELRPFRQLDAAGRGRALLWLAFGAGIGLALGLAAHVYLALLQFNPDAARAIEAAREQFDHPDARIAYMVMAVVFAPFAEEFLFRGLLYRALDREWGGMRAVAGAAVFFAVYHPILSWAPVAAVGVANALLFKRSGRLAPAVAAHMAYNAVVLAF